MKKYVIVAETGSDIPKDLAEQYGIYIVPMHVTFGDEVKDDGAFPVEDVVKYYEQTKKVPKTSGCNPEDFTKLFGEIMAEHSDCHIVYLAYSAVTTCSYQSAKLAAEDMDNVSFIDTKHVSGGQCAAVIRFAKELQKHPEWTVEEVEKSAEAISKSVSMCFVPSNLDFLRAGGRVSNATALCGNILQIHPKIELVDGYLKATKKYRGNMKKVVSALIADELSQKNYDKEEIWLGCSIGFSDELKETAIQLVKDAGFKLVNWIYTGGVITTHGGPNAFLFAGYLV